MFTSKRAARVPGAPRHHSPLMIGIRPALMAATTVTAAGLLAACGSSGTSQPDPPPAASASSTPTQLSGTGGPASSYSRRGSAREGLVCRREVAQHLRVAVELKQVVRILLRGFTQPQPICFQDDPHAPLSSEPPASSECC